MKKKYKDKWQSGNGTMLMGIVIMFSMLVLTYGAVQTFLIQNNGWNAQLASDSIADGTAVYMATDGDDYNDATQKASKLQKLVKDITGYDIQNVTVNKSKLEDDDEVEVKLNLKEQVNLFVYELAMQVMELFFVKHFSLKKASEFPVFNEGFSLL